MPTARETWEELGPTSRAGLVAGVAGVVLFTAAAVWWLARDESQVLLGDLEAPEAAAVVAELERLKVPYELADGGTRILVPGSRVDDVRLKLGASGVGLGGGVGFEVFDDSDFGVTEYAQRINYQRAMQGELSRTIAAMREVSRARVHLVMPQQSLFRGRHEPASAAVSLVLARGQSLSEEHVLGIQRLVSASVEGLEASRVTVVDQDGTTLSRVASEPGGMDSVSARLQKKQEVERYLREKVAAVLRDSLGGDRATVSVDVSLAMNEVKKKLEKVMTREDGTGWVKRRRETRNATSPEGELAGESGSTVETEYDLGRLVEETVALPGGIERLSVGVLVTAPLAEVELAKLREVVAMTVGLSAERGDSIAVHAIERALSAPAEEPLAAAPEPSPAPLAETPPAVAAGPAQPGVFWSGPFADAGWRWAPVALGVLSALATLAAGASWWRTNDGLSRAQRKNLLVELRGWLRADAPGVDPGKKL